MTEGGFVGFNCGGVVTEIATGSEERTVSIEKVDKALALMDEATQQNSAPVEQSVGACPSSRCTRCRTRR